jgi:hypothetical protein
MKSSTCSLFLHRFYGFTFRVTRNYLLNPAPMIQLEHLCKEVGLKVAVLYLFFACDVHGTGVWAVQTCWLITSARDRFVDIKKLVEINMTLWFHPLAVFVVIAGVDLAVLKPKFAKQLRISAGMMDFHARNTSHGIQDVPLPYVFCGSIPVVFCNKNLLYTFGTPISYSV